MKKLVLILFLLLTANADAYFYGAEKSSKTVLIGTDISSLESGFSCTGNACLYTAPCPATTGIDPECQYYANKNFKVWRLATAWTGWQQTLGGGLDSTYVGSVKNVLRQAALVGAKVIIDLHSSGKYPGPIGSPGAPTPPQFADLWTKIATTLDGLPGLYGYEPLNEPAFMPTGSSWPTDVQLAINGIRTADTTATIFVDGDAFASAANWLNTLVSPVACGYSTTSPLPTGNDGLKNLNDPSDLLIFTAHGYPDYNSSGTFPIAGSNVNINCSTQIPNTQCTGGENSWQCAQSMGNQLLNIPLTTNVLVDNWTKYVNWCNTSLNPYGEHLKCWLGEAAAPRDDFHWYTVLDTAIAFLQKNNILFTYWTAGPFASSTYGIYPAGLGTPTVFDQSEVAVLTKYSGAQQPGYYFLSGPSRGTASVASSNFTVDYQAYITTSIIITPNDSGAGGTFNPTSTTCAAGYNCVGTFTYTAPGTDVYQIGTTNNAGLMDPAPLGYATISDITTQYPSNYQNVNFVCKVVASYIGPAVLLRKGSDNTQQNFNFKTIHLNSCIDTDAILAWNGQVETDTLVSTSIIVAGTSQYFSDGGVKYTVSGIKFTKIDPSIFLPSAGQYSVTGAGHYRFSSSDIGAKVTISYLLPTYTVTAYDQYNTSHNLTVITADGSQNPSLADQPPFNLECTANHLPCINYLGSNRMDAVSPIPSSTQQSVFGVFAPIVHTGSNLINWDWSGIFDDQFWNNDQWFITGTPFGNGSRLYSQDSEWATISGSWTLGVSSGMRGFTNGILTTQAPAGTTPLALPFGRQNLTMGYQRFGSASGLSAMFGGLMVSQGALTDAAQTAWHNLIDGIFGISSLTSYPFYAPTLQQNIGSANAAPWDGLNELGVGGSDGIGTNFPISAAGQQYFSSLGMNIVRLVVKWEALQPNLCTGNTTFNSTVLAQYQAVINDAESKGMDVLIDNHNFGSYNYSLVSACGSPPDNGKITSATTSTYFVNFWGQLATLYASDPKIKFDLANEPAGLSAASLAILYQTTINQIRTNSFNNYIFTEWGPSFAACSDVPANGGPSFITLTDTQSKLILECHNYLQSGNIDTSEYAVQGSALSDLNGGSPIGTPGGATGFCLTNGCHLWWGEFNEAFTASMYSETSVAFNLMAAYPTVWYGWGEFRADPTGNEMYPGNILPRDFTIPYSNRPLVMPLNTYATGHTWPTASGAWPYNVQFP